LIKEKVESINEVDTCSVKFVFSPKWEVKNISEEGLAQLRNANPS
jgi:metal-sulfur cluster biosynthetic enzyme